MERIKLLLSAFIIVLLCACTTEDFQEEEVSQNIELSKSIKNKRSYTEAYEIAQKAATMFEHENPYLSRSKKVRKIDTQKGVHFVGKRKVGKGNRAFQRAGVAKHSLSLQTPSSGFSLQSA